MYYFFIFTQHGAILPRDLSERFVSNGYKSLFDVVVSYSSIEDSGLTRYVDAPHPWGDLVIMARNWCFTDDAGIAFIGIPTSTVDALYFNAHRYHYKVISVKISVKKKFTISTIFVILIQILSLTKVLRVTNVIAFIHQWEIKVCFMAF